MTFLYHLSGNSTYVYTAYLYFRYSNIILDIQKSQLEGQQRTLNCSILGVNKTDRVQHNASFHDSYR